MASVTAHGGVAQESCNSRAGMSSPSKFPLACLTLEDAGLWRIYKPSDAHNFAYTHDCQWFAAHVRPKRRLSVRARIAKEFDALPLPYSVSSPTLWLCCVELSLGLHMAFPVWCGEAFFRTDTFKYSAVADVRSDAEIAVILDECSRRGSGPAKWNPETGSYRR